MEPEFDAWFARDERPMCAEHPHRDASITCARCGAFRCEACVDRKLTGCCETCAAIATRAQLPVLTRSVAWKLILAPVFAVASAALLALRHSTVPAQLALWGLPVLLALLLLRTQRATFGWLGVMSSLLLLSWQALNVIEGGQLLRLTDVGMLAIAPLVALHGCLHLSRAQGRVQFAPT